MQMRGPPKLVFGTVVQELRRGSKSSPVSRMVPPASTPPVTRTRPSGRRVAVWEERAVLRVARVWYWAPVEM